MQDQLEIIRKACISVNKSILDLVFGCEVIYKKEHYKVVGTFRTSTINEGLYINAIELNARGYIQHFQLSESKIIGRKIGIADVLAAMLRKNVLAEKNDEPPIWKVNEKTIRLIELYNLLDDDITHQSPECIGALYELLK